MDWTYLFPPFERTDHATAALVETVLNHIPSKEVAEKMGTFYLEVSVQAAGLCFSLLSDQFNSSCPTHTGGWMAV